MQKHLIGFGLRFIILGSLIANQIANACTTQTVIVNGKISVCTICGTVVSCF